MLYKKIDPQLVLSKFYSSLSPSAQRLIFVAASVANYKTGQFFHSIESLASYAGMSRAATKRAIRELEHAKLIMRELRPGQSSRYTYLFTVESTRVTSDPPHATTRVMDDPDPGHQRPNTRVTHDPLTTNNNNLLRTTTAAARISPALIAEVKAVYGSERVEQVVAAMSKMNGYIKDANAYFRACVQRGWIPTSKKIRELDEMREKERRYEEEQEKKRQEWEKLREQVERESRDPEIQARIKAICDEFYAKLSD